MSREHDDIPCGIFDVQQLAGQSWASCFASMSSRPRLGNGCSLEVLGLWGQGLRRRAWPSTVSALVVSVTGVSGSHGNQAGNWKNSEAESKDIHVA